jgi:hypothetical protein
MLFLTKSQKKVSSRHQIAIKEVRDDILVLPNNEFRMVLETSSVNFELKSEDEQDVLVDSFQNFLNALPSPLQILVRVREVDIDQYLEQILTLKSEEKQRVYKDQLDNYSKFVKNLVSGNKILSRRFYVVVPYQADGKQKGLSLVKEHLNLTRDLVIKGLERLGMRARQLESLELLDLFYSFYNPGQIKTAELKGHTIEALIRHNYA